MEKWNRGGLDHNPFHCGWFRGTPPRYLNQLVEFLMVAAQEVNIYHVTIKHFLIIQVNGSYRLWPTDNNSKISLYEIWRHLVVKLYIRGEYPYIYLNILKYMKKQMVNLKIHALTIVIHRGSFLKTPPPLIDALLCCNTIGSYTLLQVSALYTLFVVVSQYCDYILQILHTNIWPDSGSRVKTSFFSFIYKTYSYVKFLMHKCKSKSLPTIFLF